jgi:hypothetical protein
MRTFAYFGAAVIAAALASSTALAWTTESSTGTSADGVNLADPDQFKALEDKVNAKTPQSGFSFSGSVGNGYTGPSHPFALQNEQAGGDGANFNYAPPPGFYRH